MIPTVTYDQVRLEQEGRLARLELRRHARAAEAYHAQRADTERVHGFVSTGRRAAVALGAAIVAVAAFVIL